MLLPEAENYEDLIRKFRWNIPEKFNMGVAVCDAWAEREPAREALVYVEENGDTACYSYGDLRRLSNQLANLLADRGVLPGDRIGVLLPQRPETAFAHVAALKLGAITIPLFTLFGEEALEYRLRDSGARVVITDASGAAKLSKLGDRLPELTTIFCVDGDDGAAQDLASHMAGHQDTFTPFETAADDPALIIYTSGTTGQP